MDDIVDETMSGNSQHPRPAKLDIFQGTEELLNHNLEDYQYFDSDFDKLLSLSHHASQVINKIIPNVTQIDQKDGTNIDMKDGTNIDLKDGTIIDLKDGTNTVLEDGTNIEEEDGTNIEEEDGTNIDQEDGTEAPLNEFEDAARNRKVNLKYTNSDRFRPNFNPPKGFRLQEGRRSRRAK